MKACNFAVVIPAYNEHKNIKTLAQDIIAAYPGVQIFIIDDSDTKNASLLKSSIEKHHIPVQVCFRKKKLGRGSAVLYGIKRALSDTNATYIIEMDADYSHDPKDIGQFLRKAHTADCIVGSRYINGSSIIDWPFSRKIQSQVINVLFRTLFAVPVSDYTNGFRMYSRTAAEFLCRFPLQETGFIWLTESIYALHNNGFSISEVPITFRDRTKGKSSAGVREHIDALRGVLRIKRSVHQNR